ncbi:hypothetical protein RCL1_002112 [Eukaryota sp. TZLM3-RCL]
MTSWFLQLRALTRKNFLLLKRSWLSLMVQLVLIPVLILVLITITGSFFNRNAEFMDDIPERQPEFILEHIPRCTPPYGSSCYSIAYAPECTLLRDIIISIAAESGLDFETDVISFASLAELDTFSLQNPNRTQFAYVFPDLDTTSTQFPTDSPVRYSIMVNTTAWTCPPAELQNCRLDFINGIYIIAKQIMDKYIISSTFDEPVSLSTSLRRTVHPQLVALDVFAMFGRSIVFFVYLIFSLTILATLLGEKEKGIKLYMRLTAMRDGPFWISHTLSAVFCLLLLTVSFWALGYVFDIKMFMTTSPLVLFTHFLLVSIQVTVFIYFISVFFQSTRAGVISGFAVVMISYIFDSIAVHLFIPMVDEWIRVLFTWYPTVPCELAIYLMATVAADATRDSGLSWSEIDTKLGISVYSVLDSWVFLIRNIVVYFVAAWYLDNVLPSGCNHRRPWYFPFTLSYWTGRASQVPDLTKITHPEGKIIHEDVDREREAVLNANPNDFPVLIKRLHKKFDKFVAVEDLCLSVAQNETMCLLGPNGAGKTTAIKSCVSLDKPTGGAAFILGHPVGGIPARNMLTKIGYCPQFDCLFEQLTFKEHLVFYANLKGIGMKQAIIDADKLLNDVKLSEASTKLSSQGSGGMKRRLSIAISLVGNPKFLVLDEPCTGLDIKVRANIWEIITSIKKDRAILMTTHSMEEAEQLATRVSIMCHSRLWAIGSTLHLRSTFGSGFKILVEINEDSNVDGLRNAVSLFEDSGISVNSVTNTQVVFEALQTSFDYLPDFLRYLEDNKSVFKSGEIGISLSSLKDVFIELREKSDKQFVIDFPEFASKVASSSE